MLHTINTISSCPYCTLIGIPTEIYILINSQWPTRYSQVRLHFQWTRADHSNLSKSSAAFRQWWQRHGCPLTRWPAVVQTTLDNCVICSGSTKMVDPSRISANPASQLFLGLPDDLVLAGVAFKLRKEPPPRVCDMG